MQSYKEYPLGVGGGMVKDLAPEDLDENTFSDIHNLRMKDGKLVPVQGYEQIFSPVPQPPEHAIGVIRQGSPQLYVAGNGQIHRNSNGTWSNVTRLVGGDYTTGVPWNSTLLNGCVFMNNGGDKLQVLELGDNEFKDSANIPASFTAKVFRSFKNYLFALNVNEGVTQLEQSLRWSDPADPGTEPPSWDVTDPTTQAGQTVLADTDGTIVDAQQLRDQLIIYKTDSVYSCQFIGGIYVFSFQKIINNRGALSKNCVATFEDNHFVVGYDDIYVHDGLQAKSISEGKVKKFFYEDLDQDYLDNVFVIPHYEEKEVWVCYPNDDAINGSCNKALVWSWVYNTWSLRDVPNIIDSATAIIDPQQEDLWDTGTSVSWDLGGLHWDANNYSPANLSVLMVSKENDLVYQVDDSATFDGSTFDFVLEKLSYSFGTEDHVKHLNHLTPRIGGQGVLNTRYGTQNHLGDGIAWQSIGEYTLGRFRTYTRGQGRYFSIRFSANTADCLPAIVRLDSYLTLEGEK